MTPNYAVPSIVIAIVPLGKGRMPSKADLGVQHSKTPAVCVPVSHLGDSFSYCQEGWPEGDAPWQ